MGGVTSVFLAGVCEKTSTYFLNIIILVGGGRKSERLQAAMCFLPINLTLQEEESHE
jgi:hypothetical protein